MKLMMWSACLAMTLGVAACDKRAPANPPTPAADMSAPAASQPGATTPPSGAASQ